MNPRSHVLEREIVYPPSSGDSDSSSGCNMPICGMPCQPPQWGLRTDDVYELAILTGCSDDLKPSRSFGMLNILKSNAHHKKWVCFCCCCPQQQH